MSFWLFLGFLGFGIAVMPFPKSKFEARANLAFIGTLIIASVLIASALS